MPVNGEFAVVAPVFVHVKVEIVQLSAKTALIFGINAAQVPAVVFAVTFVGHVIVGFVMSVMVTVKLQVAVLFAPSFTVYVTVVTPKLKLVPLT